MSQCAIYVALSILALIFSACSIIKTEKFSYVENGAFKVNIRDQEFANSGIHNIDLCVAKAKSRGFQQSEAQCFFHGYDISGLKVKWSSPRRIEIFIIDGNISLFRNYAIISNDVPAPIDFHVSLHDGS
ncbi:MAG: hypothetical protein JSS44_01130 [Proteobacteria bacterium]|nr:hypothetical protein [Pseudomonadota bacterium]MBS0462572.1 hypothetical protein [Pseudomonadota bacterium]MBS0463626.1 hypothetical protein [Pseudomonadota bacterium]